MQAWSVPHTPAEGVQMCLQHPRCHAGFLRAWLANGFNKVVVDRMIALLRDRQASSDRDEGPRVVITGDFIIF